MNATAKKPIAPDALVSVFVCQLAGSERGRQALADLRDLLNNGGIGLDQENIKALQALLTLATSAGLGGTVLDTLYPYRHAKR